MTKTKSLRREPLPSVRDAWISVGVSLSGADDRALGDIIERALVASPWHTFADLALAIDDAFGRWELGGRRLFTLADGTQVGEVGDDRRRSQVLDYRRTRLQRLAGDEPFAYTMEDGTRWRHECLLLGVIDPNDVAPDRPGHPVAYESVGWVRVLSSDTR